MAVYKLLIYPTDPERPVPAIEDVGARLQSLGLLGTPFKCRGKTRYLAGERFLQLITFLGCSPNIELEPPADRDELDAACNSGRFCHLRLAPSPDRLRFRADPHMPAPRCPQCRQVVRHWPALLEDWQATPENYRWECKACGYRGTLFGLNFRRKGGFGRLFIEVWGIFPSEAVPGASLLATLGELSGCPWHYLYVQD